MNAAITSMDEALAFRERERAFPPTHTPVPRVRRWVRRTRLSVDPNAASRHGSSTLRSANARTDEGRRRSEEHTSELQSRRDLVCRLLLEKKKKKKIKV